jgi:hypothetical protein
VKVSHKVAEQIFRQEAKNAIEGNVDHNWVTIFEELSAACEISGRTHIAFVCTAILAKAVNIQADAHSVKANPKGNAQIDERAYSARSLAHGVIVPVAIELRVDLGVSGREPLNNQPYFRMHRIDDDTPIHSNAREAFNIVKKIVSRLEKMTDPEEAKQALRSFIFVRKKFEARFFEKINIGQITLENLIKVIEAFVMENSEGGKRAQAIAAGLLDVFAGDGRIGVGKINDPSRHYPGDIVIYNEDSNEIIDKIFEVRDKPVHLHDIFIFGKKALESGVKEVAVLAVCSKQPPLDEEKISQWSDQYNMGLTLFLGWHAFISQVIFWSEPHHVVAIIEAFSRIQHRMNELEVAADSIEKLHDTLKGFTDHS